MPAFPFVAEGGNRGQGIQAARLQFFKGGGEQMPHAARNADAAHDKLPHVLAGFRQDQPRLRRFKGNGDIGPHSFRLGAAKQPGEPGGDIQGENEGMQPKGVGSPHKLAFQWAEGA